MSVLGIIRIAFKSLARNKTRTFLTMLGIIIGVAAVITMLAIGQGAKKIVEDQVNSMGTNVIMVYSNFSQSTVRQAAGGGNLLEIEDVEAIKNQLDGILYATPVYNSFGQLKYEGNNWRTGVTGVDADFFFIRDMQVSSGELFHSSDVENGAKVCVIGKTVADNLFGEVAPLGQTIRINTAPFRVIGVLDAKGQSAMGQDQDDIVIVPLTTAQERLLGITWLHNISVQAENPEVIDKVQEDITTLLRARHRLAPDVPDNFTVRNLAAVMATAQETTRTITLLLGNIAAISLVVGGIGIMNIMLVSVTERTREIGIRKALGATFNNILLQFLIESIVIGVTGGFIGIGVGMAGSYAISYFAGWDTVVSPLSIIIAFVFSVMIGLFFGLYPARKAALLDPIEALRYE